MNAEDVRRGGARVKVADRKAYEGHKSQCFWFDAGEWNLTPASVHGGAYKVRVRSKTGRLYTRYCGRGAPAFAWLKAEKLRSIEPSEEARKIQDLQEQLELLEAEQRAMQANLAAANEELRQSEHQLVKAVDRVAKQPRDMLPPSILVKELETALAATNAAEAAKKAALEAAPVLQQQAQQLLDTTEQLLETRPSTPLPDNPDEYQRQLEEDSLLLG